MKHIRGGKLISSRKAKRRSCKDGITWGSIGIPHKEATGHFAVVGATGSGKTVSLRMLMQSILPTRALIYDPKSDMLPIIKGICPEANIQTLNPFDSRCVYWDMAKDVTSPASAQQLAGALIKGSNQDSQPYFNDTARHLLAGMITVFNKRASKNWTLRDIMLAKSSMETTKSILSLEPETKPQLEHFSNEDTARSVFSTFQTRLQEYEFIAAAWDRAKEGVSLTKWLNSDDILLLGNSPEASRATNEINRIIFQRMTELLLSKEETQTDKTWVILDEVRQAGKLDALNLLLTTGRSKGACVVLGFQDIEGMRDVYGKEVANELVGQCGNKAILKLYSPETAEWASKLFGESEVVEKVKNSSGFTESRVTRPLVSSGELLSLKRTNLLGGSEGYYIVPSVGRYFCRISGAALTSSLAPKSELLVGFSERDEFQLRSWQDEDLDRLGIVEGSIW